MYVCVSVCEFEYAFVCVCELCVRAFFSLSVCMSLNVFEFECVCVRACVRACMRL